MNASSHVLKDADQRFGLLVDAVKDYAIFLLDAEGYVLTWNVGAERIKGYRAKEIIGKHFSTFYTQDMRDRKHPEYELEVAEKEGRYEEEGIRLRKDGSEFWASVTITAIKDESGRVTSYAKITRDITERKTHEEQLRESEERMRLLIEAVKDYAIFMVDVKGNVASWNTGAERLTGYNAQEIIGQHLSIFYPPEALARGYPDVELIAAQENGRYEEEGIRIKKGGAEYWSNVTLTPLHDEHGRHRGFAKVTRDITERKLAEDALKKAHQDLEHKVQQRTTELLGAVERLQREIDERKIVEKELVKAKEAAYASNDAKNSFLANMSHEIRTPLGAILGFSDLLLQHDVNESDRTLYLKTLRRNGYLLLTIINDVLDLSKVESGTFQIDKSHIELNEFLGEIMASMSLKANEKGLSITIEADGAIPRVIETDPIRLKQIIFNVVGNAVKFTESGRVAIVLKELTQIRGSSKLAIDVIDTGAGISADNANKLFEPFVQVDASLTRRHGGTGLGLAISRRLAQALGGDVILSESTLGKGSTFTIIVDSGTPPTRTILFESSNETDKAVTVNEAKESLAPLRILVVEDQLDNQLLISRILKRLSADVDLAENGEEGVRKAIHNDYDVVLMDLQMPIMDGYQAAAKLRQHGYDKPIIAITAHAFAEDKERTRESGFSGHLVKPINKESLFNTLSAFKPQS